MPDVVFSGMSKLSKDETHSIAAAALVGISGYLLSLLTCEGIFPRIGAVIVCIGVFFATRGFALRMDTFEPVVEEMKKKKIDEGIAMLDSRRGEVPDDDLEKAKKAFLDQARKIENDGRRKIYRLKLRLIRVESSIIMAGTLIWAFGDWMVVGLSVECLQ
jgi:hypothetical protein